jgi:hypothetical protein
MKQQILNLKKAFFLITIMGLWMSSANAQSKGNKRVNDSYGNWSFGVGINVVNDSGTKGKDFFNTSENWNMTSPFMVSIEYYIDNQFSLVATGSMNKYVEGKNIDNTGLIIKDFEPDYLAIDLATRLYFGDLFTSYTFDPYIFLGAGYTTIGAYKSVPFEENSLRTDLDHIAIDENGFYDVPEIGRITINGGIGFNYWFAETFGLNFNFATKVGMASGEYKTGPNMVSNQMQFSLGVIYFFSK